MKIVKYLIEYLIGLFQPPPEFPLQRLRVQLDIRPIEPNDHWRMVDDRYIT